MNDDFGVYVHVPWCRHVCPYCDFNVYAARTPPEREYVATLRAEITAHAREATWAPPRRARSVYLGGGTPSLLSPRAIDDVLGSVACAVGLTPGAEVTLEANPGTVTRAELAAMRAAGVNRLSLGAVSFDARHLRTLGRDHGGDEIARAVDSARGAGFTNVSLDLVFAVPGQTVGEWERDVEAAIALAPDHVSTYCLTYEEGTPFHGWRASGRLRPVADDDEAEMAERAARRLEAAGFGRYEISSWARPGFESRHNVGYWDGSDYLGVGPGAHSFSRLPAPGRRLVSERLPARWAAAVAAGGTAVASEERLAEPQARAEFCFTGLRRTVGVDLAEFRRRFGTTLSDAFPHVARLAADGLVESAGDRLRLTAYGTRFADAVGATFV
jgi:putative oxygen-independent coproporphyrinogen III oxidase